MVQRTYILDVIVRGEPLDPVSLAEPSEVTLGRGIESDLVLDDPHLSRRHVTIVRTDSGDLWVHDLGSKNRTSLNGSKVEKGRIDVGDVLTVGECKIIVRERDIKGPTSTLELIGSAAIESRRVELDAGDTSAFVSPENPMAAGQARLEGIYRLAQHLVGALSQQDVIDHVDLALRDCVDFDRYFVGLGDPEQGTFEVVWARTGDGQDEPATPIRMSETILEEVQRYRKAVLIEAPTVQLSNPTDSVRSLGISSFICAPLLLNGQFLGLIYADRRGARDCLASEDLKYLQGVAHLAGLALDDISLRKQLERENSELRLALERRDAFVANSSPMLEVLSLVRRFSVGESPVLILGETGTGKEHIARMVHDGSSRKDGPFVPFNCALSSPTLIESELFGHVKGAFTDASHDRKGRFELADGGSLFLDEIGEMPPEIQAKLLRVLQEKKVWPVGAEQPVSVDVRLISATHQQLKKMRKAGQFRDDLYYRIGVLTIEIPRLSRRDDDVIAIAESVLPDGLSLSEEVRCALRAYTWPGNVRELQNVIEQACFRAVGKQIKLDDLPSEIAREGRRQPIESSLSTLRETEAKLIIRTLAAVDGNKRRAAEVLAISRNTLYQKIKQYGL